MILIIDNYDSFTYNLRHEMEALGYDCLVRRNDEISLGEIAALGPSRIVLSPGPGNPGQAGITLAVIREFAGKIPMLGVCLGHQALGQAFGGNVIRAPRARHGKASRIRHEGHGLFRDLPAGFRATRYHSLMVERSSLPECFVVDAETDDGLIMAIRHREFPLYGLQFHPESIATVGGRHLLLNFLREDARSVAGSETLMNAMVTEGMTPDEIGNVLLAIRERGVTADELVGFARSLRKHAVSIESASPADPQNAGLPTRAGDEILLDVCGTGGDGAGTFNVSTAVAFVLAAGGVRVAKHGNRSVSSRCGSFDVLDALGVDYGPESVHITRGIRENHLAFLFAPGFHPKLKAMAPIRRSLRVPTVFNLLGPLLNPAKLTHQLVGVNEARLLPMMAAVLAAQGLSAALVVCGADGLDEIALHGPTEVALLRAGEITYARLSPEDFGVSMAPLSAVQGGSAATNAAILEAIFAGVKGAPRDLVVVNAAAAFVITGMAENYREGAKLAGTLLDSGAVLAQLDRHRTRRSA